MKKTMIVLIVGLFVIMTQTSDSTFAVNDGNGNSGVVVVS